MSCFFLEKTSSITKTAIVFLLGVSFVFSLIYPSSLKAQDYTSPSFILRAPVITIEGGRTTSPSFEYISSTGQTVTGESTSPSFILRSGFLYFEAAPPPTGGISTANVTFSGKAYPKSTVTLLKDGQIVATTVAEVDASFQISLTGIFAGSYIFSLYTQDSEERSSSLLIIPLGLTGGITTNVKEIFLSPTIEIDKIEVKKGEDLLIFGQSVPGAKIIIYLKSKEKESFFETTTDEEGKYAYTLSSAPLDFGEYQINAISSLENISSNLSKIINFTVGTKTVLKKLVKKCPPKGDFNDDCQVNLIDFSILLYWFGKSNPPSKIDLDGNNLCDLVDFSIMAYYWTG